MWAAHSSSVKNFRPHTAQFTALSSSLSQDEISLADPSVDGKTIVGVEKQLFPAAGCSLSTDSTCAVSNSILLRSLSAVRTFSWGKWHSSFEISVWNKKIPKPTFLLLEKVSTSTHSSRMRTDRRLTVSGGIYLLRGVCLMREGEGYAYGGLPAPWHCGKVNPPPGEHRHVWKHYLPATSFVGAKKSSGLCAFYSVVLGTLRHWCMITINNII